MTDATTITIDPEFAAMIPPLTDEEYAQLRENIRRDGCTDTLKVWKSASILLDGHNRYKICGELDAGFEVEEIALPDRESAEDWIDANQLGRRNLAPDQMSLLRGRRYNRTKSPHGGTGANQHTKEQTAQNEQSADMADILANQYGVSRATIVRDGQFADAMEKLKAIDPDIERDIVSGSGKPKAAVIKAAALLNKHPEIAASVLKGDVTGKQADNQVKSIAAEQRISDAAVFAVQDKWLVTSDQSVVQCQAVITDPPYGIIDEMWEPEHLEQFTREWSTRWRECGADLFLIFWSQRYLFEGRQWFDETLAGYHFQQLLIWHYPNNKSPQSRLGFKQTWEPCFFYRRNGSERQVKVNGGNWGDDMNDFDCHVAAVPQSNFTDDKHKVHPAQKEVSVMRWLVGATTSPGELVVDPFCGSGTTGIAAVQLGRRFRGIEIDNGYAEKAKGRITLYGKQ